MCMVYMRVCVVCFQCACVVCMCAICMRGVYSMCVYVVSVYACVYCQGVECVDVCVYVYMLAIGYLFIQSFPIHCTGTNSLPICLQFPDKPDVLSNGQIMPHSMCSGVGFIHSKLCACR